MHRFWKSSYGFNGVILWGGLCFAIALGSYALTGFQARYWADDYCYNSVLQADGFWQAQASFYRHTSDRFSVIPLVGVSEFFGPRAIRFWPVAAILLALTGLVWTLEQAARSGGWKIAPAWRLLLAEVILFFTLWQAPNLFQVLYWRTGMLTYFMPLVLGVFLTGWILREARRANDFPGRRPFVATLWSLGGTFWLAFFAAGFSETNAVLQAGLLGLALVAVLRCDARERRARPAAGQPRTAAGHLPWLLTALAATLLAMLVLIISPSNQLRLVHMPEPAGPFVLLAYSFRYGWDFIRDTLATQWLPTLLTWVIAGSMGFAWQSQSGQAARPRRVFAWLVGGLVCMYLGIVSVCAPSVYVEVAYPEARALIGARFLMVLGMTLAGWCCGQLATHLVPRLRLAPALALAGAVLVLGLAALYPLHAVRSALRDEHTYFASRAAQWDARDAEIRRRAQQGQRQVEVEALDSIRGLMELTPDAEKFPNGCMAGAYGLQAIRGILK